ncbi:MAG: hypothetical protein OEY06_09170 [Gammaproteobacteria bacterium]|nr:hypothetical protein [Gammaproteobacteria bacterium]
MNKITPLVLAACLSFCLSSCGGGDTKDINSKNRSKNTTEVDAVKKVKDIEVKEIQVKEVKVTNGINGANGIDGKQSQTIRFIENNSKYAFVGDQLTNTAVGGLGTGAITYSSDNPDIASINTTTGKVKILSSGATLIRVHKAEDSTYSAANDFYYINAVPKNIPFTAKIGSKDALLDFPAEANGLVLNHSTNAKCNLDNYRACQNSALDLLDGSNIVDTSTHHYQTSTYWLKHGDVQSYGATISSKQFSNRYIHQAVNFNDGTGDKLWLIGGDGGSLKNDVWSSSDGINWTQKTTNAAFSARKGHQVVSFNDGSGDKLWLIGGNDGSLKNDVWSSSDGINWTQKTASAAFSARSAHQVVRFNDGSRDKLWLIGGADDRKINNIWSSTTNDSNTNDVWSSSDGINWTQETVSAEFSARKNHQVVSFNDGSGDKLWLIGGDDGDFKNDVWSSSNGINWVQQINNAAFSNRSAHQVVSFNNNNGNKLWLIGGDDGELKNDVWSSNDGINWTQQIDSAAFSARYAHQVVSFNDGNGNKLWLIGGSEGTKTNDVWSSSNGINWAQQTTNAEFSARRFHQAVNFNDGSGNKLWLIGGDDGTKTNDVWSSSDGIDWTKETANAAFSERKNHQVVSFNNGSGNKLWLIGGDDGEKRNDVWSSGDGINWIQLTSSAEFSAREDHQVVIFNDGSGDKLWLVGGNDGSKTNDVWSSSDGINWTQKTASAAFSARKDYQVVNFNDGSGDKLWLIGGFDDAFKNDVWSSSDGINWIQLTSSAEFSARKNHQVVSFNDGGGDKLWLIGGSDGTYKNDVWSSSNGINWLQQSASTAFSARLSHQVVNFNDGSGNKLWLIGGDDVSLKNDVWSSSNGVDWRYGTHSFIRFN